MAGGGDMNKAAPAPEGKPAGGKLIPNTTPRKLPWLQANPKPALPSIPSNGTANVDGAYPGTYPEDSDSPFVTPPSTQASSPLVQRSIPSKPLYRDPIEIARTIASTSLFHRHPPVPSSGRRVSVSSAGASSTCPTTRNKLPQTTRYPLRKVPSPLKEESITSQTHSPAKTRRPSVIRVRDTIPFRPSKQPEDTVGAAQRRKSSLAPVPAHLEEPLPSPDLYAEPSPLLRFRPPEDTVGASQRRKSSLAPVPTHLEEPLPAPDAIQVPVQLSPAVVEYAQLSPTQPVPRRNPFESTRDKRRLSNAIEGLEELVQEAVEVADQTADQRQVQEVYQIIEDATAAVQEAAAPARNLMETTSPLEVSGSSDESSGSSSSSSSVDYEAKPPSGLKQYRPSEVTDWAYKDHEPQKLKPYPSSLSDLDDPIDQPSPKFTVRNDDDLLLPPQPAQTAARDHTDFVLRPARAREYSRGRSPPRRSRGAEPELRRHRHRRRRSPDDEPQFRDPRSESLSISDEEEDIRFRRRGRRSHRHDLSVRDQSHHHTFNLRRHRRRQPIARNWGTRKKRLTAAVACLNTAVLGIIVGIYAGMVPRIQYVLADEQHHVILGNVVLYAGMAITTFFSWPLPLLHGRKPYILASLALALPLQFPQAMVVSAHRSPKNAGFRTGLLVSRACSGLVLGFANVNFITVLLDLFGASLQSKNPHQEFVVASDVRRHGGGMGMWLGVWSWCAIGSLAVGFQIGAAIIQHRTPDWGFYIVVIILVVALFINILTPETRRSTYRKSVTEVYDRDENFITRRVARGEVKLHISTEGPKYWFEEVWAGVKLTMMMLMQPGFLVLSFYLGWIYAQVTLVTLLLGAMLSRSYRWHPSYVGLGVMSVAIGALLAVPLTKAGIFSRERKNPFRTDSMTFQRQVTWSSHMVRRIIFMLTLPLMGLAYAVSAAGRPRPYMVPIVFAGAVGFLTILAISECHGLIMETFDTSDLQPGVNTRHRLQSMAVQDRRRRTNYSSFPRVTAGIFASQTFAYILGSIATEIGGIMTRRIGAQASIGVTAGILLGVTILLTAVLWRFREVQVIPNHAFGTRRDTKAWQEFKEMGKDDWKAVIIGNPSGKMRRMSVLELGSLTRWTEIRKLNFLIRDEKQQTASSRRL